MARLVRAGGGNGRKLGRRASRTGRLVLCLILVLFGHATIVPILFLASYATSLLFSFLFILPSACLRFTHAHNLTLPPSDATYQHLCDAVDVVYHAAAHVNLSLPYESLRKSNVCSTLVCIDLRGG